MLKGVLLGVAMIVLMGLSSLVGDMLGNPFNLISVALFLAGLVCAATGRAILRRRFFILMSGEKDPADVERKDGEEKASDSIINRLNP